MSGGMENRVNLVRFSFARVDLMHGLGFSVRHRVEIAESCCQVLHSICHILPINTRTNTMSRTRPSPPLG